jgi:nicotinamidase/pyrazinamidase
MARLVAWARENAVVHVASADDHELSDPEISTTPDFVNTYPPHCLRGTRGAHRIPETEQVDPLLLSHIAYPPGLVRELVADRTEILLLKKSFDVFTNPNAEAVLEALDPSDVIVFGVATDVCDHAAIVGLLRRGRRVTFVEDAACGLDEQRTSACLAEWRNAGVRFTTSENVASAF